VSDPVGDVAMQQDLFGGEVPLAQAPRATGDVSAPVAREPGWYLIATNTAGPRSWHRLASGTSGTVITACGVRGRTVADASRQIVRCQACVDAGG